MRLVLDTNVVVSGLLWHGAPRRLIDLAINDAFTLYSSPTLIEELTNTLSYKKFAKRISHYETRIETLVTQYQSLVRLVSPTHTPRVVSADPDDDHVLACALAAKADAIVSGDQHLLSLKQYQGIPIITFAETMHRIGFP